MKTQTNYSKPDSVNEYTTSNTETRNDDTVIHTDLRDLKISTDDSDF